MPIHIFLADDHPVVRDGLKSILKEVKDFIIIGEASDGRQAVQQVRKLKPDVVVMDIAMPNLNGIEATRQIIEDNPAVRVIFLSVHDTAEHIYQAFQAGARGYLLKGSVGQEIFEAIQTVQAGRPYLSQGISGVLVDEFLTKPHHDQPNPMDRLSSREREILQLVVEGFSSAKIAETLFISPKTVDTYRSRLMEKLEIGNLPTLVKFAIKHGLTPLD